jgi:hypothetical protein
VPAAVNAPYTTVEAVARRRALDHQTAVDLVDFVLLPALRHTS